MNNLVRINGYKLIKMSMIFIRIRNYQISKEERWRKVDIIDRVYQIWICLVKKYIWIEG